MFTPIQTGDGSSTFYSEAFGEWFHSREGACREAQKTYVETAQIARRATGEKLHILDICYGLGYNTAAALEAIWPVWAQSVQGQQCQVMVKALELDLEVPRSAIAHNLLQHYSEPVVNVLRSLAADCRYQQQNLSAELLVGDARQQVQSLVAQAWQADVIFFDPFSPPRCPQLWTVDFFQQVAKCLKREGGVLVTYSCAAAVRAAMQQCGLVIGEIAAGGRQWPGTIAAFPTATGATREIPAGGEPLSLQAQEHLLTRAAVPYRDPSLRATAGEILKARSQAQENSDRLPTGPWRRRWKAMAEAKKAAEEAG
ncbi:MAG: MnmC family methyltransferase [Cyanobacteria bacterium J06623_4]